ncbi:hydroxyacid dehydrogenase [Candidatus Micrarchaeota archaeon]|nr:hydroxyacid dehydrogenase [Candidatus Micrarchaeota archaeon]
MTRIAFFELEPWEKAFFQKRLKGFNLDFVDGHLGAKTATKAKNADAISVFIYSKIDTDVLSKLPKLKLIATQSTGFDHVDVKAAKGKGITVCNVPEYGSNTVAEHTFALLLSLSRKIPESTERTRKGDFRLDGLRGFDLCGKTIGIIGFGKIGKHVGRIAQGFEMNIVAFDPFLTQKAAKEAGVKSISLPALLKQSDVISLHAPLTDKTRHTINLKNLNQIKPGAVILNTSRGGLIETEALLRGLKDKRIAAAGLDVLEEECFIREERELLHEAFQKTCDLKTALEEHALIAQENVIVTPHNAFNSQEALERILETTAENVESFYKGKAKNIVGP